VAFQKASQSLPPAGGKELGIIFPRDMRVGKNTSQAASVEFCRKATKLCAQQTAIPLAENRRFFASYMYLFACNVDAAMR